jgi:DNA-binding transcriptional MerR regulator
VLTVGQVARAAGVSTKAVRLYEARGLLPAAGRSPAGYRLFAADTVGTVRFIRRARALGLGLDAAGEILGAGRDGTRPCGRTRELLDRRIGEIDEALAELSALREALVTARAQEPAPDELAEGGSAPVCPMIEHNRGRDTGAQV